VPLAPVPSSSAISAPGPCVRSCGAFVQVCAHCEVWGDLVTVRVVLAACGGDLL
jgi:hypothetical protein